MKRNRKIYLGGPIYLSILTLSPCMHSLIHFLISPTPCTFYVQNAGLSLRGGRNINVNDNKLLFLPKLDRHFLAMNSQVRMCSNQTDWDHFELDTGVVIRTLPATYVIFWSGPRYLFPFLVKVVLSETDLFCAVFHSHHDPIKPQNIGKIRVVQSSHLQ